MEFKNQILLFLFLLVNYLRLTTCYSVPFRLVFQPLPNMNCFSVHAALSARVFALQHASFDLSNCQSKVHILNNQLFLLTPHPLLHPELFLCSSALCW